MNLPVPAGVNADSSDVKGAVEEAWKAASSLPEDLNRMGREGYWCRHLRMLSSQWSSLVVVASVNIQRCRPYHRR